MNGTINSKAIIFDLGNVIFKCSMNNALSCWAKASNQEFNTILSKLDLNHPEHDKFERGEINEREFSQFISNRINYELSLDQFRLGWNSIYGEEIKGIRELLDELSINHRILGLSNTNKTHSKIWKEKYKEVLSRLEIVFSSHEIGSRKPEKESYQVLIDYLKVSPSNLIFLDDRIENVETAEEFGIEGIWVKSFEQMKHELMTKLSPTLYKR